ncbi:MAG: Hsp20/alpha crystallin family protein [Patescibacteria group bacterium]|jgi:HSP20 family protein
MDYKEFFITPQGFSEDDLQELETKSQSAPGAPDAEGQLAVDVYQTDGAIVVKTVVAGVKPEDIQISINNEVLTIRGQRQADKKIAADDFYYRECYWGKFSRSIVLPVEVKQDKIEAIFKNGVLTITLPKANAEKSVRIKVED